MIDPMHFEIILRNIISNAIKYTRKGGTINFNCKKSEANKIEISICDTGIGMNRTLINNVIKKRTVDSSTGTMKEKGTGIGLQIVHELVKANNGLVNIQSKPDRGTCISLIFPKK